MDSNSSKYLELDIPTIMPMFNSEEKVDELNRLLDILAKRKKYSIIVSMLIVFQQHNFQKLLKDFLTDGVKEIIIKYPLRVVSYHGVPFTVNNFFRGMRVEYSKHKLFQREVIEGNEYVYVNLVYTCIFLSDEIAKICKCSKNLKLKTIHRSLIDEVDTNINNNENNFDNGNVSSKYINESKNLDGNEEIKKQVEINPGRVTRRQKNNFLNGTNGVINLEDSEEEKEEESNHNNNNNNNNNNTEEKNKNINEQEKSYQNDESMNVNRDNTKKQSEEKAVKGIIKYQDDLNYLKSTMQDILTIFDYSDTSPLSTFLNNNIDNISQLKTTFISMQSIGQNGEKFVDNLIKLIPENMYDDINTAMENDENKIKLIKDESFQNKVNELDNLYTDYEKTKNLIIYYYSIIQSTVKNIRHSGQNFDKTMIKEDLEYLNINEKKYEEKVEEIFPLLNKIYTYFTQKYPMKFIVENLQSESNELSKFDINIRTFNNFLQGVSSLFPSEDGHEHNCLDLIVNKKLSYEEKEKQFKNKLIDEKNLLIKYIEPLRKHFDEKIKEEK